MCCELSHLSSFLVGGSAQLMAASCAGDALAQLAAEDAAQAVTAACVAVSMSFTTSSGWETIATWLDGTSTVLAPMRLANRRWASGGSAWSSAATRNQVGSAFQAGTPITSWKADADNACCTAYMTLALPGSTSAAKWFTKSSSDSQVKPCLSVKRCASAGVTGPCASSAPSDSPWSSPKAAM